MTEATRIPMGVLTSEGHTCAYSKRPRPAHLADEARRRQLPIRKRNGDVLRVKGVTNPRLREQKPPARTGPEVGERVRVLTRQVEIVVLERAVAHRLGTSLARYSGP